jgi:uncharacterized Zn finger protein
MPPRTWTPHVTAADRARAAQREVESLRKKGKTVAPIVITGRKIAETFWGKAWCKNLESYSDYETRLPRGRSYVRSGAVVDLAIAEGRVDALVRGTSTYTVVLTIAPLAAERWQGIVTACSGQISSLVDLLRGKLSREVMDIVTDTRGGMFPAPDEIALDCSCPDWANMCKHVAAVMYGIGARLDAEPALLFTLRGVAPADLLARAAFGQTKRTTISQERALDPSSLSRIFGIELVDDD